MEKIRHGKKNKDKSKRFSKKRNSREENGSNTPKSVALSNSFKPLVEYSDVSSEDLSGPEAGEIQSGIESPLSYNSDDDEMSAHSMRRSARYPRSIVEEEYYLHRL